MLLTVTRYGLTGYFLYIAYRVYTSPYAINLAHTEVVLLTVKCVAAAILCYTLLGELDY